jgi:hypothetical protein
MVFAVKQSPRAVLSGVFSALACIMVFDPAVYIVGMSNIKFVVFSASEDIDVIHDYFFVIPHVIDDSQRPSLRDALAKLSYTPDTLTNTDYNTDGH